MARDSLQTLTEPMFYTLMVLLSECSGVDVMSRVGELSQGRVSIGPGTLYSMLSKFEENNLIQMTRQEGRQKWYLITDAGREKLQEECRRLRQMLDDYQALADINSKNCVIIGYVKE